MSPGKKYLPGNIRAPYKVVLILGHHTCVVHPRRQRAIRGHGGRVRSSRGGRRHHATNARKERRRRTGDEALDPRNSSGTGLPRVPLGGNLRGIRGGKNVITPLWSFYVVLLTHSCLTLHGGHSSLAWTPQRQISKQVKHSATGCPRHPAWRQRFPVFSSFSFSFPLAHHGFVTKPNNCSKTNDELQIPGTLSSYNYVCGGRVIVHNRDFKDPNEQGIAVLWGSSPKVVATTICRGNEFILERSLI